MIITESTKDIPNQENYFAIFVSSTEILNKT